MDGNFTEATRIPLWDPERDDTLVCRQVRQETHDVKTFVFSGREPRAFRFYPGQFMTFELPVEGMIQRCYTVSGSAARPYRVEITVKRVPGGPGSNWLHDHMRPGAKSPSPDRWASSPPTPPPGRSSCSCRPAAASPR
ncbi:FAD-binding oxidoreductase [Mangrovicoccus ximenensis]|uniref:FAD-binding oxidoreductase n=1 Tax=Mangrovicoccus ximenensis TaxID=1911570 RepID=UPI001F34E014|nr:FAD-binding oxidoreductase [Mangrovicoccus ximenensis]